MLNNIYAPLSGAIAQEKVLEVIANNLANMNTVGFKQDQVSFSLLESEPQKSYSDPLPPANFKVDLNKFSPIIENDFSFVGVAEIQKDFTQGSEISTENPMDVMIEGDGYFVINTFEGERYTRAGNFTVNTEGALVDQKGNPVMGQKGAIYLRHGSFTVNPLGEIYQDGQLLDKLKLLKFSDNSNLERIGDNHYFYNGSKSDISEASKSRVKQGSLESSNVNAIKSMTAMIIAHRSYEAYQKAITNFDRMMDKSSNTIGAIRI